jgi:hypothetical protein
MKNRGNFFPRRIISGGQTGADRAALDWALAHRVPHGGFCPRGRRAEDGPIARRYRLRQTRTAHSPERTEANVRAAHATLIFCQRPPGPGSRLTAELCRRHGKPCLRVGPRTPVRVVAGFLNRHRPRVLNVAGNRASQDPSVYARVWEVLEALWAGRGRRPTG